MKKFLSLIGVLIVLGLLSIAMAYIAVSSEWGTNWLVNKAVNSIPGELKIGQKQGRLNTALTFKDVTYHYHNTTITTDKITLHWHLMALLNQKFSISSLKINKLKITTVAKNALENEAGTVVAPSRVHDQHTAVDTAKNNNSTDAFPPLKVHFTNTEIKELTLENPGIHTPIIFQKLQLNAKIYPKLLSIQLVTRMTKPTPAHIRIETSGKPTNYRIALVVDQNSNHWSAQSQGDLKHLTFQSKENQLLSGTVQLQGKATFGKNLLLFVETDITGINLEPLFAEWPSKINAHITSHFSDDNINLSITALSGIMKQQPISGEFHYQKNGDDNHFIDSDLQIGDGKLTAKGTVNSHVDLKWDINFPNIQGLLSQYKLKGSFISQGTLLGPKTAPIIHMTASGKKLHFKEWSAEAFAINAEYQDHQQPLKFNFITEKLNHNQRPLGDLQGLLMGTERQHTFKLDYRYQQSSIKMSGSGQVSDNHWEGKLKNFTLSSPHTHEWHLKSITPISWSPESLKISPLCLMNNHTQFCMQSQWEKEGALTADINADKIPLDILNPWLGDLSLHGEITASAKFRSAVNTPPSLDLNIELIPGVFKYILDDVSRSFQYHGGHISAKLNDTEFTAKASLELLQKSRITANINSDPKRWNPNNWAMNPINGDFSVDAPQLDFLAALIPKIAKTRGSAKARGTITGTLHQPIVSGAATVSNASFIVPDVNAEVSKLSATGSLHDSQLHYEGRGTAGQGNFKITGTTGIINKQLHTQLALDGQNMLISDTPGVKVTATPHLKMSIVDKTMSLTGKLFIPKGEFRSYDYNDTLELPDEITYRQETPLKPAESEPVRLSTFIDLKLGENISIDSNGLKGRLGGALTINDKPGGATTAFGRLALTAGQYDFRGQPLRVERGILNFNGGPIDNPNLNVRAVRRIGVGGLYQGLTPSDQNRIVGITITGSLAKHTLTLFSEPDDINQSDMLSYLLLGQSISSVSGGSGNAKALLGAAQALNLSGGGGTLSRFKSQLEQKLGLSELDITSYETKDKASPESTIQHTAFVLGRYLSPKLYVNYSFDILDHTNVFRIRYFLNKKWSIQSESSSDGNGLDILYSFERE